MPVPQVERSALPLADPCSPPSPCPARQRSVAWTGLALLAAVCAWARSSPSLRSARWLGAPRRFGVPRRPGAHRYRHPRARLRHPGPRRRLRASSPGRLQTPFRPFLGHGPHACGAGGAVRPPRWSPVATQLRRSPAPRRPRSYSSLSPLHSLTVLSRNKRVARDSARRKRRASDKRSALMEERQRQGRTSPAVRFPPASSHGHTSSCLTAGLRRSGPVLIEQRAARLGHAALATLPRGRRSEPDVRAPFFVAPRGRIHF
jgi:hypothetical protein